MMKIKLLPGFLVAFALWHAQIGIGNNVTSLDDSEVLQIDALTKVFFFQMSSFPI